MHVIPDDEPDPVARDAIRRWRDERWKARLLDLISRFKNYQGTGRERPSVTIDGMKAGDVGLILSVLYWPYSELDGGHGAKPKASYMDPIRDQIRWVEKSLEPRTAIVVKSGSDLDKAAGGKRLGLVHALEGGFALGGDRGTVAESVAELAEAGVGYITLAHLFWREIATNAPALPFLSDRFYHRLFPQPDEGLSNLGRAAVKAMVEHRVLIDVTHMSGSSIEDTVRLAGKGVPLLASHGAARFSRPGRPGYEYNLDKRRVRQIRDSGGVVGLIMCRHYISGRFKRPKDADVSFKHLCRHIDRIAKWCRGSFDHIGIGSDLDGFIKPALPGFTDMDNMADLQDRLADRYGPENAEKISSGNALRMLRYRFS
jgi:microsomal dipeptidase-like Zn-dependent dipeptidase